MSLISDIDYDNFTAVKQILYCGIYGSRNTTKTFYMRSDIGNQASESACIVVCFAFTLELS